jgi:hypothetical protein
MRRRCMPEERDANDPFRKWSLHRSSRDNVDLCGATSDGARSVIKAVDVCSPRPPPASARAMRQDWQALQTGKNPPKLAAEYIITTVD